LSVEERIALNKAIEAEKAAALAEKLFGK